jgi:hypothetical protein
LADRLPGFPQEWQHPRGKRRGFCDGGDRFEVQVRVFRGSFGIDLLLGDQQQHLVTACAHRLGDRDPWEQVAARASAGDEDFEGL